MDGLGAGSSGDFAVWLPVRSVDVWLVAVRLVGARAVGVVHGTAVARDDPATTSVGLQFS